MKSLKIFPDLRFSNKYELVNVIDRSKSGLSRADLLNCYPGIESDISEMITNGDIIAVKNRETRIEILYPRGTPFFSKLSGNISGQVNSQILITSEDLREEIRRGEAIFVDGHWYRVGSNLFNRPGSQPQRAKPPLSVTSHEDLSSKNEYAVPFTSTEVPLDVNIPSSFKDLQGMKYGCTNDVKLRWKRTLEDMRRFSDESKLQAELLRLKLLTKPGIASTQRVHTNLLESKRIKRKTRTSKFTRLTNTHLKGTAIGDLLANTPDTT